MDGPGVARQGPETDPNGTREIDRRLLYAFLPLGHTKRQFRLLKLYKDADNHRLRGRLIIGSLDSHPRFNGLAYTWDASQGETDLEVNHKRIWIPTTLYRALESLRYQFRTEPTNERSQLCCGSSRSVLTKTTRPREMPYLPSCPKYTSVPQTSCFSSASSIR